MCMSEGLDLSPSSTYMALEYLMQTKHSVNFHVTNGQYRARVYLCEEASGVVSIKRSVESTSVKRQLDRNSRGKANEAKTHGRPEAVMSAAEPADSNSREEKRIKLLSTLCPKDGGKRKRKRKMAGYAPLAHVF
jgi:hypothetical protein